VTHSSVLMPDKIKAQSNAAISALQADNGSIRMAISAMYAFIDDNTTQSRRFNNLMDGFPNSYNSDALSAWRTDVMIIKEKTNAAQGVAPAATRGTKWHNHWSSYSDTNKRQEFLKE